jgi:hypothetical protein
MDTYVLEKDVAKYLNKSKDNILVVFGHNDKFMKRTELRNLFKQPEYKFTAEDGNRYYQVLNRPLISEENMKKLLNKKYSIYNIHVLVNVIKVFSDNQPQDIHKRSIYDIEPYTLEDYLSV